MFYDYPPCATLVNQKKNGFKSVPVQQQTVKLQTIRDRMRGLYITSRPVENTIIAPYCQTLQIRWSPVLLPDL